MVQQNIDVVELGRKCRTQVTLVPSANDIYEHRQKKTHCEILLSLFTNLSYL